MVEEFHISSLIVYGKPDALPAIQSAILGISGAEIHGFDENGKIVVTLETHDENQIQDGMTAINLIEGVISTALVFHHVEEMLPERETPA